MGTKQALFIIFIIWLVVYMVSTEVFEQDGGSSIIIATAIAAVPGYLFARYKTDEAVDKLLGRNPDTPTSVLPEAKLE